MTQEEIKYHNQLWYYKTYNQLIDKCIQMESEGYPDDMYTEVHHILPKCMGGTNDKSNLVRMPVRYHIVAHLLLSKIYINNNKLICAAFLMININNTIISSRVAAQVREAFINSRIGTHHSEETKKKMSESQLGEKNHMYHREFTFEERQAISERVKKRYETESPEERKKYASYSLRGKIFSEDHRKKLSEANKGKKHSEETKKKISIATSGENNGHYGKKHSKETKEKMKEAWKSRREIGVSSETRNKLSKSLKGKNSKKVQGPDGTIYNSITEASQILHVDRNTLRNWINKFPEKGYKILK